jgi:hypothetical protein
MAMFLGHIALMLELTVFAAGLTLWYFGRERTATALRAGGVIAMVGATLSALCTGYYLVRYSVQGEVDHAYPFHRRMADEMMEGGGMMSGRMMGGRMMEGLRERQGEVPPRPGEPSPPPGHEQHHPSEAPE